MIFTPTATYDTIGTVILLGVTAWNAYTNNKIKTVVLQMEINLRREFNGRYQPRTEADIIAHNVEHRLDRLEANR